jgi:hypothetical protein
VTTRHCWAKGFPTRVYPCDPTGMDTLLRHTMHNQSLVSLTLARDRATTSSQPMFVYCIGSEVGVSSVMVVFASGSATIHAVQASRYVPRCRGVTGGGRSDHCSARFGMVAYMCRTVQWHDYPKN